MSYSIFRVRNVKCRVYKISISVMISFLFFSCMVMIANAQVIDDIGNIEENQPIVHQDDQLIPAPEESNIANILQRIDNLVTVAEKYKKDGILPTEHTDAIYDQIVDAIDELTDLLKTSNNAYKFLNTKGVDRLIIPIISINYEPLKKELLILLKTLLTTIPVTTKEIMPMKIIDKLLDIFENDDNLALKTHALDIMYLWLPENPKIQARVMKLKGLEPFYNQLTKLDISVVYTSLELFNKLLEEHLKARDKKLQSNKGDLEKLVLYERIGLIERMSTPTVCNGLLNIFEGIHFRDDINTSPSFFDLLKNIKPFCLKHYSGKTQAAKVFESIRKYLVTKELDNVKEISELLDEYIKNINDNIRDEF